MKLIRVVAIWPENQNEAPLTLSEGPASRLKELGYRRREGAWFPPNELVKQHVREELRESMRVINVITDLTPAKLLVTIPTYALEWLQDICKNNTGSTPSMVVANLIIDQMQRDQDAAIAEAAKEIKAE